MFASFFALFIIHYKVFVILVLSERHCTAVFLEVNCSASGIFYITFWFVYVTECLCKRRPVQGNIQSHVFVAGSPD